MPQTTQNWIFCLTWLNTLNVTMWIRTLHVQVILPALLHIKPLQQIHDEQTGVSTMLKLVSRSNDPSCQIAKNTKMRVSMRNLDLLNKWSPASSLRLCKHQVFGIIFFFYIFLVASVAVSVTPLIEHDGCHCCFAANTAATQAQLSLWWSRWWKLKEVWLKSSNI